ncbi:GIY-YIG nuclease family protein [Nostocoides jenkinsii]|uniref:Bacteriophage T5 Orf172 DNA-binding domain-containing protein n=1 Tax=Nostocoides jenkinsii Ben 74 TaxID=1193518 RepID=A0A077MG95_9MICO|nr:GIY-YIG nuclease family protein [Tetrasphaera jenkinsii]CCI54558.1 conserved hypothetical protein [Tetrasphaera jenkinsii Ben 74]
MPTRDHILSELRRIGADLGRAPGKRVFERETGIRESDWAGKYWVRWSDAVAEAGLSPNVLNPRLDDAVVAQALATEIRRLGRVPIINELKMRSAEDSDFPNAKTFQRQGGKAGMVEMVRQFCQADPGKWADVLGMLPEPAEPLPAAMASEPELVRGYVYLIKSGKRFKIGLSTDVQRRLLQLNTGMPEAGELIHVITTDDPAGIESYWHRRFAAKRVRPDAEWFDLNADDVRAFRPRRFQ